jgi:hypothetical protein
MSYDLYKTWMSILLSFTTLISNMAMSYYFAKREHERPGAVRKRG